MCKEQKEVSKIVMTIIWKKNRTWGNNPHLNATVTFADGSRKNTKTYKCSGCGYDKESTVIGKLFNDYLRYELIKRADVIKDKKNSNRLPYGIDCYTRALPTGLSEDVFSFGQGIGTYCYREISEFIGGNFSGECSTPTSDVYIFEKHFTWE